MTRSVDELTNEHVNPDDGSSSVVDEHDQYLTCRIDDTFYGIDIMRIEEIIEYGHITSVPLAPSKIRGVINLRGDVIPVIDLSVRLGKRRQAVTGKTCNIIVEINNDGGPVRIGLVVDGVDRVVNIPEENVESTPSFGIDIDSQYVEGMGKVMGQFVVLLNLDKVLAIDELSRFGDIRMDSAG